MPPLTPCYSRRRVAIFNDSASTLEHHGHVVRDARIRRVFTAQVSQIAMPHLNVERLVLANRPEVIVYDLAMPYESAWDFLEDDAAALRPWPVFHSFSRANNKAALESVVGPTQAVQVIGTPGDRHELLRAIDTAGPPPGLSILGQPPR